MLKIGQNKVGRRKGMLSLFGFRVYFSGVSFKILVGLHGWLEVEEEEGSCFDVDMDTA